MTQLLQWTYLGICSLEGLKVRIVKNEFIPARVDQIISFCYTASESLVPH